MKMILASSAFACMAIGQAHGQTLPPSNIQFHGSLTETAITNRIGNINGLPQNVCLSGTIGNVVAGGLSFNYNSSNTILQTINAPYTEVYIFGSGSSPASYNTLSVYNSSNNSSTGYAVTAASISYSAPIVAMSVTYTYIGGDGGACSETFSGYFRTEF